MEKGFFEVVDMADNLCALLESIDDLMFDFYSENYMDFDKSIGTYRLMQCRFETNGAKMEIIRERIIEAVKNSKKLCRRVNYYHKK